MVREASTAGPFLDRLRKVDFVATADAAKSRGGDLRLAITDREGRRLRFAAEIKTSYFDRASLNSVIATAIATRHRKRDPLFVLARYIPLPTGERLLDAGVNFVDLAGNMHLTLGAHFERTILGRMEEKRGRESRSVTAAHLQALFLFATHPEAASWPVREIAAHAGVGKSKAAEIRSALKETGAIEKDRFRLHKANEDLLVSGYSQILRPKLVLGRFRPPEKDVGAFLKRLPESLRGSAYRCALTGGPAADVLQHYYRGPEVSLFVSDGGGELRQKLRLLPDRTGPITLLDAFGEVVYWREIAPFTVAPPWMVYAELLDSEDPRAHEAAAELREEFLRQ